MKVSIKGTNIILTPDIHIFIDKCLKKIGKMVDSYEDEAICEIEVGKESMHHKTGQVYKAEIQLYFLGKKLINISNSGDIYSAILSAEDGILQEILKRKNKQSTLIRKTGRKIKETIRYFYK